MVAVHLETLAAGQIQIGEHVGTRDCRDEGLLRVNVSRIREWRGHNGRRRRSRHDQPSVEAPSVLARILAAEKVWRRALPMDGGFVLGHKGTKGCRPMNEPKVRHLVPMRQGKIKFYGTTCKVGGVWAGGGSGGGSGGKPR